MRKIAITTLMIVAFTLVMPAVAWSGEWLHVNVQNFDDEAESVRVNLPLSVARAVIPMVEKELSKELNLNEHNISLADMREVWNELRKEREVDFVQIDSDEAKVRVSLSGRHVLVKTAEGSKAQVDVKIPVEVVDALLEGDGNTLNISGALDQLIRAKSTELVSVRDDDATVRIWIDDRNQF